MGTSRTPFKRAPCEYNISAHLAEHQSDLSPLCCYSRQLLLDLLPEFLQGPDLVWLQLHGGDHGLLEELQWRPLLQHVGQRFRR